MTALYNEIDPKAAAWLRALIDAGRIAPGIVDERSIEDLTPDYLLQFTQVHFFAGIGVWSYALRAAGWPDDRPVWTGSCPCQPFSAAGKGGGFADERHLWPAFHYLIDQCRPDVVFGEQVASKDGLGWLDLVQADLEGTGYASGAVDLCAAGVGAPHIRQRLWWFGERIAGGLSDAGGQRGRSGQSGREDASYVGLAGQAGQLARGTEQRRFGWGPSKESFEPGEIERSDGFRDAGGLADINGNRRPSELQRGGDQQLRNEGGLRGSRDRSERRRSNDWPGPTNGLWADVDWLHCRDGKWRPVEPGTFPLAHGAPERVGRLRGYGNAIVAQAAEAFITAYLDATVN